MRIIDFESGEFIDEFRFFVWNVIFLENGYYFLCFYRYGEILDGVKVLVVRFFWKDELGERMVFG